MNEELGHVIHISKRHSGNSHMWTSATLGEYLEFLAQELRQKRKRLGLGVSSRALILMDKATVHSNTTFAPLRERFERAHNALLLHGASYNYVAIPGGLGKHKMVLYIFFLYGYSFGIDMFNKFRCNKIMHVNYIRTTCRMGRHRRPKRWVSSILSWPTKSSNENIRRYGTSNEKSISRYFSFSGWKTTF